MPTRIYDLLRSAYLLYSKNCAFSSVFSVRPQAAYTPATGQINLTGFGVAVTSLGLYFVRPGKVDFLWLRLEPSPPFQSLHENHVLQIPPPPTFAFSCKSGGSPQVGVFYRHEPRWAGGFLSSSPLNPRSQGVKRKHLF